MKRTLRKGSKVIRQNRPGWRKKVIGRKQTKHYHNPKKIKGKEWEST